MKVATGSETKGKNPRTICPECNGAYMQNAYVLLQAKGKKNWKPIGIYCSACRHFIQTPKKTSKKLEVVCSCDKACNGCGDNS